MNWSRAIKRIFSLCLISGSLGFYANNRLQLDASYAVVAAPAIVISAPADGVVSHHLKSFSVTPADEVMATVQAATLTDPEIRAATAELETTKAEVTALEELIDFSQQQRSKSTARQAALTSRRTEHLRRLLSQAESELAVKSAVKEAADVVLARSNRLCSEGLIGVQDCENAQSQAQIGDREVASARNQLGIAQFLLDAGKSGTDVAQDFGAELSYARQQRDETALRLAQLKEQLATKSARVKALDFRVHPPSTEIKVGSTSRAWSVFKQSGAHVQEGEALFQVVDCSQLFVFATATGHKYEKLRIGMTARVKVGERTLQGKIAQLLGPYGTFSQDRGMQPQPPVILSGDDSTSASVAVEVPELQALLGKSCEVGTKTEVTFVQ